MLLPHSWAKGLWFRAQDKKLNVKLIMGVATLAMMLAGCSAGAGLLTGKENVPQASAVPVGNNLALPPDLQLAAPTQTTDAYQPNGNVAPISAPAAKPAKVALAKPGAGSLYGAAPAAGTTGDIFDQYGISKFKADGSRKSGFELNEELSAAIKKKKRETNPSYGTIGNVGDLFKQ